MQEPSPTLAAWVQGLTLLPLVRAVAVGSSYLSSRLFAIWLLPFTYTAI